MARFFFRMAAPAILLLGATIAGGAMAADAGMSGMGGAMTAPADMEMQRGMQRMRHDMNAAPMTGDPDHDFVAMMLPHHVGAVDMARVELEHGKDPTLLKLARDIVASQEREIAFMRQWLATHPPATAAH